MSNLYTVSVKDQWGEEKSVVVDLAKITAITPPEGHTTYTDLCAAWKFQAP